LFAIFPDFVDLEKVGKEASKKKNYLPDHFIRLDQLLLTLEIRYLLIGVWA